MSDSNNRARQLRKNQTWPEEKLWQEIRMRQLCGLKFWRQHPIDIFIVDFCCCQKKLVIELDGKSHDEKSFEYDRRREACLVARGYKVLRFSNDEVLKELSWVLDMILMGCGIDPGEPMTQ